MSHYFNEKCFTLLVAIDSLYFHFQLTIQHVVMEVTVERALTMDSMRELEMYLSIHLIAVQEIDAMQSMKGVLMASTSVHQVITMMRLPIMAMDDSSKELER
jgi:hypothetical protein